MPVSTYENSSVSGLIFAKPENGTFGLFSSGGLTSLCSESAEKEAERRPYIYEDESVLARRFQINDTTRVEQVLIQTIPI
jgi:hypothetical protein